LLPNTHQRREDITAEWLRRLRRDRKIPSAGELPKEELLDHLPYLLDTLIKQLRGTPVDPGRQSVPWRSSLETALLSGRSATGDFHPAKGID
jgi:RsbT co-antagonist protein rsbRD N-terminal domain